ncbi:MAG: AsmA family protein [Betaproteobacteria bacterium]
MSPESAPDRPRRLRPRSRAGRVALAMLLLLVALVWAFDWNWCRPLLKHYVESHSGRSFECADLQVRFDGLDPTVTLRGVKIQNAPWAASKEPFLQAGRVSATISWRTLWSDLAVVRLIVLEDAQVDMERQADGLRNWRLGHPDDRGPPHVWVLALDARNSRLHTIHAGIGLEMDAQSTPLPAVQVLPGHADLPLTKRLQFKGTFKGHPFDGDAAVSDVLTFGATPRDFALRAVAHLGALRLEAAGLSKDVRGLGDFDCDVQARADGAGALWPLPEAFTRMRPLAAQGHVARNGTAWTAKDVHVRAGRQTSLVADLAFTGGTKSDTPRRRVQATLRDAVIDVDDLSLLRGKTPPGEKPDAPGERPDEDQALSAKPLDLGRLREFDADVDLKNARFTGSERGMAQTLRGRAVLQDGVLELRGLDAGLAGGHVTGSLRADASRTPAEIALDVTARALRLDQLSSTLAGNGALIGALDGRATLKMRGDSPRALIGGASGSVSVALADGATVSNRLDAKLGLDGGHWLRSLFDKSARVPVVCGAVTLAVERGVATSRRFVFETADTALAGRGSANLVDETVDATLTPARKKVALLALDKAIHAAGSWHDVKIALKPPTDDVPARCETISAPAR